MKAFGFQGMLLFMATFVPSKNLFMFLRASMTARQIFAQSECKGLARILLSFCYVSRKFEAGAPRECPDDHM